MGSVRTRVTSPVAVVAAVGLAVAMLSPATAQPVASSDPAGPLLRLEAVPGSVVRSLDVPLDGLARSRGTSVSTGPMRATAFSLVGVTWRGAAEATVRVRTRSDGAWTGWQMVPLLHDLPDAGTEGVVGLRSTQPWWVGRSTGIDVQVTGAVRDLQLALIDPGVAATDATATASRRTAKPHKPDKPNKAPKPNIRSRKTWGAKERWRNGGPYYNRTIKQVHVHHTATGNDYRRKEVQALLRSVYRYHTHNLGWSDIGYNFVVDRFGRIWQGRAGGNGRPVRGAHTLGFNETSTGVAVLGTFTSKAANERVRRALVHLAAWKLDRYHRRPKGTVTVFSRGSDKFAAGTKVRLRVIDGHRDTNDTECPGGRLYRKLPGIRLRAQARVNRFDPPR